MTSSSEASVPAGAAKAGASPSTKLFVRQTSGLVRELGIPAATGISLASVAVVNTFINFNAGLTDFAKADMYLPLVAAAVIWLVAMFAYRYLLRAVPRAGGEYVYLSRIVSPVAGSVAGLGIAVVFTYVLSTNAHFAAQFTPFMLSGLGAAFHSTAVANAGNHLTSNIAIAWLSVVVMLIVAALSLFSVKIVARIIFWLIVLQLVAFVALIGILAFKSHADFVTAYGSFSHHPGAYQATITAAHANRVLFGTSIASAVAIIPFMVLNYNGVLYSYYVGGELRRPGRTYLYASTISIVVLVILWVGVWALLRARAGLTFMQAQANLGVINPGAVVPRAVEHDDLAGRRQVRHVTLEVPLPALTLGRDVERDHPGVPGVQVLHEALDGAPLAGGIAALEDQHDPVPGVLDPVLQLEQLDLQLPLLVVVLLTAQTFGVGIFLPPGVHNAPVGVAEHRVILVRLIHPHARRHHVSAARIARGQTPVTSHTGPIHGPVLPVLLSQHPGQPWLPATPQARFTRSSPPHAIAGAGSRRPAGGRPMSRSG